MMMPRFVFAALLWVGLVGVLTGLCYQPVARQEARIRSAAAAGDDAALLAEARDYLSRNACLPGASAVARAYLAALARAGLQDEAAKFARRWPDLAGTTP
jgi:hypothetical protein